MPVSGQKFEIENASDYIYWAEVDEGMLVVHKTGKSDSTDDQVLVRWSSDTLRNLLVWADQEQNVTTSITGPMAAQVRQKAKELMISPEMFVWHAVKVFVEVGELE